MADTIASLLGIRPARASFVDLTTGEAKEFQFNPPSLDEEAGVNWKMFESPGLSHKRPQAVSGDNMRWRFSIYFDQIYYSLAKGRPTSSPGTLPAGSDFSDESSLPSEVEDWRNFFLSLLAFRRVPAGGTNRIASASPTPVHFEWPGLVSTTVRVDKATLKHTMFRSKTPRPRIYSIDISLFEDPPEGVRIFADDVRKNGTIRPWAASSRRS